MIPIPNRVLTEAISVAVTPLVGVVWKGITELVLSKSILRVDVIGVNIRMAISIRICATKPVNGGIAPDADTGIGIVSTNVVAITIFVSVCVLGKIEWEGVTIPSVKGVVVTIGITILVTPLMVAEGSTDVLG